jgi:hypothetical protein
MDDDAQTLAEIRERIASRGEQADDQLRAALRITFVALAREYAPDGGDDRPPAH